MIRFTDDPAVLKRAGIVGRHEDFRTVRGKACVIDVTGDVWQLDYPRGVRIVGSIGWANNDGRPHADWTPWTTQSWETDCSKTFGPYLEITVETVREIFGWSAEVFP